MKLHEGLLAALLSLPTNYDITRVRSYTFFVILLSGAVLIGIGYDNLPSFWNESVSACNLRLWVEVYLPCSLQTSLTVSRYRTHIGPSWSLLCPLPLWILLICQRSSENKFEFKRGKFIEGGKGHDMIHKLFVMPRN